MRTLFRHEATVTNGNNVRCEGRISNRNISVTMSEYSNTAVVSGALDSLHPVMIHQLDSGRSIQCEARLELHSVRDVRIIQRGESVLSCSLTGRLNVWDFKTGKLSLEISGGCTSHATCLDVTEREGEALAAVSGVSGGVKIVELRSGQKVLDVGPACVPVRVVRFSPDGKLVVTGHDTGTVQVESVRSTNHHLDCLVILV